MKAIRVLEYGRPPVLTEIPSGCHICWNGTLRPSGGDNFQGERPNFQDFLESLS